MKVDNGYAGSVKFRSDVLYYRNYVTIAYVHSVVNHLQGFENIVSGVREIKDATNNERSALVRQFVLDQMQTIHKGEVSISKNTAGYPVIICDGKETDMPVSLSHDGDFVAYSVNMAGY